MSKSTQLPLSRQQRIAKFKRNNPDATAHEIALKFDATDHQVNYALKLDKQGRLWRKIEKKAPELIDPPANIDQADELIDSQYGYSIAQLNSDRDMDVATRIALLSKLLTARKTIQSLRLERHLKRTDAVVIKAIILRYMPEATDDEVIKIYREAVVSCQITE